MKLDSSSSVILLFTNITLLPVVLLFFNMSWLASQPLRYWGRAQRKVTAGRRKKPWLLYDAEQILAIATNHSEVFANKIFLKLLLLFCTVFPSLFQKSI